MWPVDKMTIMMANPAVAAFPSRVTDPPVFSFTMGVAVAANISTKVPISSVAIWSQDQRFEVRQFITSLKYDFLHKCCIIGEVISLLWKHTLRLRETVGGCTTGAVK